MTDARPALASPDAQAWTTRRLLAWTGQALAAKGVQEARLASEILLTHVIGGKRLDLFTDPDRPASASELATLRGLMARALKHEPVQYLTAQAFFFGLTLRCDKRALIPRPCTELIVERVLQHARARRRALAEAGPTQQAGAVVVDLCTGSGCVALALAKQLPGAAVHATDISRDALALAGENALALGLADRVSLHAGDLLSALPEGLRGGVDYLVANPPYIPDHEWEAVPTNVREHEPSLALRGGVDGLALVGPIVREAPHYLGPGGLLLVEIAACTSAAVLELARSTQGLAEAAVVKDLDGLDRVLVAHRA